MNSKEGSMVNKAKTDSIVEISNLTKHYKSGSNVVKALDGVNLKLPRGKMIAIKGASGSGKTTLLNMLGAFDKPTSGSVVIDGVDVSEIKGTDEVKYRLKKVGFIFQAYNLIPNLTAKENVILPLELSGVKKKQREIRAREILESVGIGSGLQIRRSAKLSGGEQQRVAIARALANDPPIILADEPTGNLDSKTGKRIVDILLSLSKAGKTVILVTHSSGVASKADIVLEMEDGKIIAS
jgi:putative ABC transport system ATP-binding protein